MGWRWGQSCGDGWDRNGNSEDGNKVVGMGGMVTIYFTVSPRDVFRTFISTRIS